MNDDLISRHGVLRLLNAIPSEEFATKAMLIGGVNALPSAQPVEDARAMCGECDAWNKYKNYPQTEQFNPCTVCQEFDCSGCKFRRT